MRIQSFNEVEQQCRPEYNNNLDSDQLKGRKKFLQDYYSVIVEGTFLEFETLNNWIRKNISNDGFENYFYGKTDYDFGFTEFFVSNMQDAEKLKYVVPFIFTLYPNAYPKSIICRSDGSNEQIIFDPSDKNAIVMAE
jgi:hypothetical protein